MTMRSTSKPMLTAVSCRGSESVFDMGMSGRSDNSDSYNTHLSKKRGLPLTNHIECRDQTSQLVLRQTVKSLLHRHGCVPDLLDELLAVRGNPRRDMSTIVRVPLSRDQPGLLESVEQSRHVGHAVDHALTDLPPAETILAGAFENSQHIELRPGETIGPQRFVGRVIHDGR